MRTETTYYAFDNTEFYNEEECLEYERQVNVNYSSVIFLNSKFDVIKLSEIHEMDVLEDAVCEAQYIKIIDAEKAKHLFDWIVSVVGMNTDGLEEITDGMCLAYDDENADAWYDPVACMNYYANIVDKLNEVSGCR